MARQPTQQPAPRTGRADDPQALFRNAGVATSYEVQFYRDQRWRIDSMFDDGALALHEAKRMSESGRYVSVRVIEESFDPVTGEPRHATIFRGGRVAQANRKDLEDSKMRREIQLHEDLEEQQRRARRASKRQRRPEVRVPIRGICVTIVLMVAALVALRYFRP